MLVDVGILLKLLYCLANTPKVLYSGDAVINGVFLPKLQGKEWRVWDRKIGGAVIIGERLYLERLR